MNRCELEPVRERLWLPVDFSTRAVNQQTQSVCLAADSHQQEQGITNPLIPARQIPHY